MSYKIIDDDTVLEIATGKSIPLQNSKSVDTLKYLAFLAGGNVPEPRYSEQEIAHRQVDIRSNELAKVMSVDDRIDAIARSLEILEARINGDPVDESEVLNLKAQRKAMIDKRSQMRQL